MPAGRVAVGQSDSGLEWMRYGFPGLRKAVGCSAGLVRLQASEARPGRPYFLRAVVCLRRVRGFGKHGDLWGGREFLESRRDETKYEERGLDWLSEFG